jgi:hypothetical protein
MSAKIIDAIVVAAEMTGTSLSEPAIRGYSIELSAYPENQVLKALARCRRELKFKLTLADIIERLEGSDGRPNADEAFAIAIQMQDENATVVTNDEISQAWALAKLIMPDRTGARMAFRSKYESITQEAREAGKPVAWYASLGMDSGGREAPIRAGIEQCRLPARAEQVLLPPPDNGSVSNLKISQAISNLVEQKRI